MILTETDQLKENPVRIISLVPSQTELLYQLGLEKETIAITKFCIHPEKWFTSKERIGGTKTLDTDKIKKLQPDLIIANKEENVKEQVEMLARDYPVWVTEVNNLSEAYQMIKDIGSLTGTRKQADHLVHFIKNKFDLLFQTNYVNNYIPAIYLIWKEPYMTVGGDTFISNIMECGGFKNVFADKTRYPEIQIADIAASDCRVLFLSSEPYPFKQKHIDELQLSLPGVKIVLADGEMFSWYGSRLQFTADYLIDLKKRLAISS